jgi:hypothetical protein
MRSPVDTIRQGTGVGDRANGQNGPSAPRSG